MPAATPDGAGQAAAGHVRGGSTLLVGRGLPPVLVAGVLLGLLASATKDIWPMVIACALGAVVAVCLLGALVAPVPVVTVSAASPVAAGGELATRLELVNSGRYRTRPVLVAHTFCRPLVAPISWLVGPLDAGERVTWTAPRAVEHRGVAAHAHLEVQLLGAFGLFRRRIRSQVTTALVVHPAPARGLDVPALLGSAGSGRGAWTAGDDVRGVRPWRAGDSPRQVHWRSTARTGALTVLERGEPADTSVIVLAVGASTDPAFEWSLAAAAATAFAALARGAEAWLIATPTGAEPTRIRLSPANALDAFAALPDAAAPADPDALRRWIPAGAAVVLAAAPTSAPWRAQLGGVVRAAGAHLLDPGAR